MKMTGTTSPLFVCVGILLSTVVPFSDSFLVTTTKTKTTTKSRSILYASTDELIKQAGGGVPYENEKFEFDPDKEGKLKGTGLLELRLSQGVGFQMPSSSAPAEVTTYECQDWLEDIGIPSNFAKATAPAQAKVLGRTRLIEESADGDIQHIIMELPEGMHYVEGQSLSVIPPGVDEKNGKPHKPRLYSIASTRYGDLLDGKTVSLCVRRAEYVDPATGAKDPTKAGVCSNYLCNIQPGTIVNVAGPVGKTMLLPSEHDKDIIMVATGTGIAPFRGFLHRLFMETTVAKHMYTGSAWLILGVPTSGNLLYQTELEAMKRNVNFEGQLQVDYAISREMTNANGGKLYVQDVLKQNSSVLFDKLENGAIIYFCGLKGMMPGILESLEQVATEKGMDWSTKLKEYQSNKQWHVEVY